MARARITLAALRGAAATTPGAAAAAFAGTAGFTASTAGVGGTKLAVFVGLTAEVAGGETAGVFAAACGAAGAALTAAAEGFILGAAAAGDGAVTLVGTGLEETLAFDAIFCLDGAFFPPDGFDPRLTKHETMPATGKWR